MSETDGRDGSRGRRLSGGLKSAVLAALLLAGGCGQSGPLTLPEQPGSAPPSDTEQQQQQQQQQEDDEDADQDER